MVRAGCGRRDAGRGMRSAVALVLAFTVACSGATANGTTAPPPVACTFKNPIDDGADPWIIKSGANYYYVESKDNGIYVYRSTALTQPKQNPVKVWTAPASGWNETNIWAPELHHIGSHWYIYYAGGQRHANGQDAPFTTQHAGVLESDADDPQGSYTDRGMLYTGDDVAGGTNNVWAIDLTVHTINGQQYAVWSGWDQNNATTDKISQNLYIARMSSPTTISTNRVKLASPDQSWESGPELPLEEGPEFLEHNGRIFIIYSTNDSWLPSYQLGELRMTSSTADPLSASSYVKVGPVFSGTTDVYGVGHASFTVSPDGTEDWIVYHSKKDPAPGWNRAIRAQKFTWGADGSPSFGRPTAMGAGVTMPSGQCAG
jgi:GH43 family beta-xylosidase